MKYSPEERSHFFRVHATSESMARKMSGNRLVFENGKLVERYQFDYGQQELTAEERDFDYPDVSPNLVYQGMESEDGIHHTGGGPPPEFKFPDSNCPVSFQYLAFISNQDPIFGWLPFNLHLIFPVYANIEKVYLDYSNPYQPTILNGEEVDTAENDIELTGKNFHITYEPRSLAFVAVEDSDKPDYAETGLAGIPVWQQTPFIPRCPKSGRLMQFVCQLAGGNPVQLSNFDFNGLDEDDLEFWQSEFDHLHFWGDGNLYLFFEPAAKTSCLFIQSS